MRSRRKLRHPFVTTVVAAAAVGALPSCGAKVNEETTLPKTECPASRPQAGDPCNVAGECRYGVCSPPTSYESVLIFECASNVWVDRGMSSCNPPPIMECPTTEPASGTNCFQVGKACNYGGTCTPPDYRSGRSYRCGEDYHWQALPTPSCNPPPPSCPPSAPTPGDPCGGSGWCPYVDDCPSGTGWQHFSCSAGTWTLVEKYDAPCPATLPTAGSDCACALHLPKSCNYDPCPPSGTPTKSAICDVRSRKWSVAVSSCNPPPPDAGAD